ncbi:hypothetical protein J6590_051266 [Homalodisca vitripennis]|nr:hypothetical protein J6590_051266 [Homalodisca vitripennis]
MEPEILPLAKSPLASTNEGLGYPKGNTKRYTIYTPRTIPLRWRRQGLSVCKRILPATTVTRAAPALLRAALKGKECYNLVLSRS